MSEQPAIERKGFGEKLLYPLAILLVIFGMLNATPGIPGYDALVQSVLGDWASLRKFPREWFFPIVFALMMLIVVLKHSMWRSWQDKSPMRRGFGLFMDVALLTAAFGMSLTYLVEFEAICLIDQFTGERARLIAESLASEKEFAELYGLPEPTTVDRPAMRWHHGRLAGADYGRGDRNLPGLQH